MNELDDIISAWTKTRGTAEILEQLEAGDIPSCKIYTAADVVADPQYRARGMVREVLDPSRRAA